MSENFEFEKHGQKYLISVKDDHYDISFWHNFSKMRYEPDTQALLQVFCNPNIVLMDLGAANGAMSILAASLGAKVWAYEPNPIVFQSLRANVELNPSLIDKVTLISKAVSVADDLLNTDSRRLSDVLSPIVFTEWSLQTPVEVASIVEELRKCHQFNPGCEIVIKMDIEGAEWRILSDRSVLQELQRRGVILILALHPGLHRPIRGKRGFSLGLKSFIWNFRNAIDAFRLYSRLYGISDVRRTNFNLVRRPIHFCLLVLGGTHEFVIDFTGESKA